MGIVTREERKQIRQLMHDAQHNISDAFFHFGHDDKAGTMLMLKAAHEQIEEALEGVGALTAIRLT